MNSDLTNTQGVTDTSNPQAPGSAFTPSVSSDFQQSAPADSLKNHQGSISVLSTGQPINNPVPKQHSAAVYVYGILSVVMLVAAVIIYRYVKNLPAKVMAVSSDPKTAEPPQLKAAGPAVKAKVSRKKLPRSKRHK